MRGTTLLELITVLTLLGVSGAALAPTARRLADGAVAVGAREQVVALLLDGRAAAVASGGATVVLRASPPAGRIDPGSRVGPWEALDPEITMRLGSRGDSVRVRFDGLGIGRFASLTLSLHRGSATTGLVVSSYGRIRRR
jgi:hypothetical protein